MKNSRLFSQEEWDLTDRVEMEINRRASLTYAQVEYEKQGNFTVCLIGGIGGAFVGVAKRAVCDPDRPEHARRLAFRRAVENYAVS